MKIYSTQILMTAGFLGELILNGFTSWASVFIISMFLTFLYNFVMEMRESK